MIIVTSFTISFVVLVAKCKRNINQRRVQYIYGVLHNNPAFSYKKRIFSYNFPVEQDLDWKDKQNTAQEDSFQLERLQHI